jgi:hypothetical protein
MKPCAQCGIEKPNKAFPRKRGRGENYGDTCRECKPTARLGRPREKFDCPCCPAGRGHRFDEDTVCPNCGVSWFAHRQRPVACEVSDEHV